MYNSQRKKGVEGIGEALPVRENCGGGGRGRHGQGERGAPCGPRIASNQWSELIPLLRLPCKVGSSLIVHYPPDNHRKNQRVLKKVIGHVVFVHLNLEGDFKCTSQIID
jgi:hypothetical protein